MLETSRCCRYSRAAATRSGVGSDIMPMVRWMAPAGRMALGGRESEGGVLGEVVSAVKRAREAAH